MSPESEDSSRQKSERRLNWAKGLTRRFAVLSRELYSELPHGKDRRRTLRGRTMAIIGLDKIEQKKEDLKRE